MDDIEAERRAYEEKHNVKSILAPSFDSRRAIKRAINDKAYFIIIVLVSLISVVVPPLFMGCLSSDIGLAFPKTIESWILWGIMNASIAICNISILVLFKLQARKNSSSNKNFIEANEILHRRSGRKEVLIPRSPAKMNAEDYSKKILAILITTFTSSITLTSLILSFDWMTLLACLISIIITLCVSWITMIRNEEYWCEEYLLYAKWIDKELDKKEKESVKPEELSENERSENA